VGQVSYFFEPNISFISICRGPMTPPLLQRPLATDFDEDVVLRHGGESTSRGAREEVPTTAWHGVARKGAKFKDKKGK
jgi:hypothetical protein